MPDPKTILAEYHRRHQELVVRSIGGVPEALNIAAVIKRVAQAVGVEPALVQRTVREGMR